MKISAVSLILGFAIVLGTLSIAVTLADAAECPQSLDHVSYTGTFNMTAASPKMKIQIGTAQGTVSRDLIAQITSGGDCKAVCRVNAIERNEKTNSPRGMSLDCRANSFEEFSAPAQLVWETTRAGNPEIRFGTWLNGYSTAALE